MKLGQVFVDRTFSAFEGSDKIPESVKQILSKELELDTTLLMQGGDGAVAMVHKIQDGFRLGIVIDCDNQTINYAESRHRTSATKADENLRRSLVAKPIQGNRLVRVLGASDWSESIPLAEQHAPSLFELLPSESSIPWLEFSKKWQTNLFQVEEETVLNVLRRYAIPNFIEIRRHVTKKPGLLDDDIPLLAGQKNQRGIDAYPKECAPMAAVTKQMHRAWSMTSEKEDYGGVDRHLKYFAAYANGWERRGQRPPGRDFGSQSLRFRSQTHGVHWKDAAFELCARHALFRI